MPTLKRSGNAISNSTDRYFATSVSNVPQDVSDEDALSGAWKRSKAWRKSVEELGYEKAMDLKRGLDEDIWRTERLELEMQSNQRQFKEMKQHLLYDAEHLDQDIIDHGIRIGKEIHQVRKAKGLFDRWIK